MDPSRVHFMNQLPYWTWTGGGGGRRGIAPRRLLDILDKARAFATENGHIDVPPRGEGQASLRRGLEDVRRVFIEQGALSAAAIVDFEALPGWTWNAGEAAERSKVRYATIKIERPPTRQWLARAPELQVVAEGVGGLDKASLNGDRTGHWASTQRVRRKSLSSQQRSLLESIPGWTWDGMAARDRRKWDRSIGFLERYVAQGGSQTCQYLPASRTSGWAIGFVASIATERTSKWIRSLDSKLSGLAMEDGRACTVTGPAGLSRDPDSAGVEVGSHPSFGGRPLREASLLASGWDARCRRPRSWPLVRQSKVVAQPRRAKAAARGSPRRHRGMAVERPGQSRLGRTYSAPRL